MWKILKIGGITIAVVALLATAAIMGRHEHRHSVASACDGSR